MSIAARPAEPPPATEIEPYGVATIPEEARTATPMDLFRIMYAGGVTAIILSLGLYTLLLVLFPEPRGIYGPQGSRFVKSSSAEIQPITKDGSESVLGKLGLEANHPAPADGPDNAYLVDRERLPS